MTIAQVTREQTRARYPDEQGFVERDGVRVFWGIAEAIAAELDRAVGYRPVESDGATRAASLIAELL